MARYKYEHEYEVSVASIIRKAILSHQLETGGNDSGYDAVWQVRLVAHLHGHQWPCYVAAPPGRGL
jgi:hypothetical protein